MNLLLLLLILNQPTYVDTSCIPMYMVEFDGDTIAREYNVCWNIWLRTYRENYILKCSSNFNSVMYVSKKDGDISVNPLVNNKLMTCN